MYKSVLVPLDGSRRAESILDHVAELARSTRGKLVFLTALEHKVRASGDGWVSGVVPGAVTTI